MFVRDYVKAGTLLEPVPVGLRLTLQYDVEGVLEKVFEGFDGYGEDISMLVLESFLTQKNVPLSIPVKNGTSQVFGVLHTSEFMPGSGDVPYCLVDSYIQEFIEHPDKFTFYAGNMTSLATTFHGAVPIRRWLQMARFNILPGYVIPSGLQEQKFEKFICTAQFTFDYPLISDYIIFDKAGCSYYNLGMKYRTVSGVSVFVDDSGFVKARIAFDNDEFAIVDYPEAIRMNINKKSCVMLDENGNILFSNTYPNPNPNVTFICPYCGKVYKVPLYGTMQCEDRHCVSRMYPAVIHFLKTLNMPIINHDRYDQIVKKLDRPFSLVDLFSIIEYESTKVEVPIATVLKAVVYIPKSKIDYDLFCNRCNNMIQSIQYYIHNPGKIIKDLDFESRAAEFRPFMNWLNDPKNVEELDSVLSCDNIAFIHQELAIPNAVPMFRGCKVYLTGSFIRGDSTRIGSILRSYGATIVPEFNNEVSFVLVGDMHEREDGHAIRSAKINGIKVHTENDFFSRYEIDQDMSTNLY